MVTHTLIWGGAIFAAVCGVALLAWALFADRSRNRQRCCKCWYLMTRAVSLRCPECGHEARSVRELYRTRRRWRWATVSLVPLLLAVFMAIQPKVQRDGWGSVMPVTALILLLRVDDRQWVLDGVEYHISEWHPFVGGMGFYSPDEERLWRWQWRMLARSSLSRLEDETRPGPRTTYHSWLSLSADAGGDAVLRQTCMDALVRELSHPDTNVRRSAALFSVDYQDIDPSIGRAIELLDHVDPRTRVAGITSLRLIVSRTGQGVFALIDALQHEDAEVRRHALSAISSAAKYTRPVPEALHPVHALEHDEDGDVRSQRVRTLADLQSDDEAWNTIEAALWHDDPYVRRGGLDAAIDRDRQPSHIAKRMIECLDDPDADVRRTAVFVLQILSMDVLQEHRELLESFLTHDDQIVRDGVRLHRLQWISGG